jgi:hypothetical protein
MTKMPLICFALRYVVLCTVGIWRIRGGEFIIGYVLDPEPSQSLTSIHCHFPTPTSPSPSPFPFALTFFLAVFGSENAEPRTIQKKKRCRSARLSIFSSINVTTKATILHPPARCAPASPLLQHTPSHRHQVLVDCCLFRLFCQTAAT